MSLGIWILAVAMWIGLFLSAGVEFALRAIAANLVVIAFLCWGVGRPKRDARQAPRFARCPRCLSPSRSVTRTPCNLPACDPHPWHDPRFNQ